MSKEHQFIIVAGCGRLGRFLAVQLSTEGHRVTAIDPDRDRLDLLPPEFGGFSIEGDASELDLLTRAEADEADQLIAVTHDDNVNLLIAQIAMRLFKIPKVAARVNDPQKEKIYFERGIQTVCPLTLAAKELVGHTEQPLEHLEKPA